jgi:hypothetical protein
VITEFIAVNSHRPSLSLYSAPAAASFFPRERSLSFHCFRPEIGASGDPLIVLIDGLCSTACGPSFCGFPERRFWRLVPRFMASTGTQSIVHIAKEMLRIQSKSDFTEMSCLPSVSLCGEAQFGLGNAKSLKRGFCQIGRPRRTSIEPGQRSDSRKGIGSEKI